MLQFPSSFHELVCIISQNACGNFRTTWKYVHTRFRLRPLLSLKIDVFLSMFKGERKSYKEPSALLPVGVCASLCVLYFLPSERIGTIVAISTSKRVFLNKKKDMIIEGFVGDT